MNITALAWPADRLGEALLALARTAGLDPRPTAEPPSSAALGEGSGEALGPWIEAAARTLGIEAEPVEVPYAEAGRLVARAAPALLRLADEGEPRFLALAASRPGKVLALAPDGRTHSVPVSALRDALCRKVDERLGPEVDGILDEAGVPPRRWERVRRAVLAERAGQTRVGGCWLLHLPPGASFWKTARRARLPGLAGGVVAAHALQHALLLLAWWVLGRGVLQGYLDPGWLLAWGLLLATFLPFRGVETWTAGVLTTRAGSLLKKRLLAGTLRVEPEEIRHQGAGQLLGRVLNSEALETLILTGGHVGLVTLTEIALALPILAAGAGGWPHVLLLLAWTAFACLLAWRYFRRRRAWTAARLDMTHDLVEQMTGHRTRLAQQPPGRWHEREDLQLEGYAGLSAAMDDRAALLRAVVPRGWLLVSVALLAPGFVSGRSSPEGLAVALGGVLFTYWSFWKMVRGLYDLAEAAITWKQAAPLFRAASREEAPGSPEAVFTPAPAAGPEGPPVVLEAHDLVFRYAGRADPVLHGCGLTLRSGDRLLLEGPSGGGKSTLASLLAGLRAPDAGLLLLQGLDRFSLGAEGWRRRVVAAPQFQENHVLTDTFAFNLLMGRGWPPSPADLAEAEAVCRELGLDGLLNRMPAGLLQMVGESGWQLSHGEKSRLYIARALLQNAELVVLDESFAALDPESLRQALSCVLARARTLIVIAHP